MKSFSFVLTGLHGALSSWRAWIEIYDKAADLIRKWVALLMESVD